MSWKDIIKKGEMPQPPKSRSLLEMTCENNHKFTLGETKIKKILGAKKYNNISRRCPVCGKKATFLEVKKGVDKTVKRLGFYDVLKMLSPRQFLEGMQGIVGGEITGGYSKTSRGRQSLSMTLTFDGGVLKVRGAGGKFFVNLNGTAIGENYNLTELRPITEEKLGEFRIKKSIKTATRSAELWAMNDEEYYFKIRAYIKSLVKSGHDKEDTIQELAVWLPDMMRHIDGFMEELETEDWDGSIDAISDVDWEVVARNYEDDVDGILEDFA